jgi:FkbM family methyltransferase|tara:strand:+ start:372 stop:1040 length:669 start_codon:yes stop_codon:yes gene_type:complete
MDHPIVDKLVSLVVWPKGTKPHILDIGANQGQFAREMREWFGNAYIYSIEANPYCEKKLGKQKGSGQLNEYEIVALGKQEGVLDFFYSERKPAGKGASFYPEIEQGDLLSMQVPVRRLDDVMLGKHFHLIKIDVQGAEKDVIEGGRTIIDKAKYVILELAIKPYNEGAPTGVEMIELMNSLGFGLTNCITEHRSSNKQVLQIDGLFEKGIENATQPMEYFSV